MENCYEVRRYWRISWRHKRGNHGRVPHHKQLVDKFIAQGVVLGIGPFVDGGNMAIFKTREAAEAFSKQDPFVLEGLVKTYVIRQWSDSLLPE